MTRILIRHADIVTLDESGSVLQDAEIAIAEGKIVAARAAPDGFDPDEVVDAGGRVVMPGFFNAHTHSALILVRDAANKTLAERWLDDPAWLLRSGLTADDVYWGAAHAMVEMVRSGTVGFADHYFFMDKVAELVLSSGLRANLSWCTFGHGEGEVGADLTGVASFAREWHGAGDGRIRTSLGPHSMRLCSAVFLARSAAVAARLGVGIHLHLFERADEVLAGDGVDGQTRVEILNRNGVLDVPALVVHPVRLTEPDYDILASKGATAVCCPTTEMALGLGSTPVTALLNHGVPVAVGTGAPAPVQRLGMLREGRHLTFLERHEGTTPADTREDLPLRLITQNSARALGFPFSGMIASGWNADLVLVDSRSPRWHPKGDIASGVLFGAEESDITDVMVAGKWVMRSRALLTLDEERILAEVTRRSARFVRSAGPGRTAARD